MQAGMSIFLQLWEFWKWSKYWWLPEAVESSRGGQLWIRTERHHIVDNWMQNGASSDVLCSKSFSCLKSANKGMANTFLNAGQNISLA